MQIFKFIEFKSRFFKFDDRIVFDVTKICFEFLVFMIVAACDDTINFLVYDQKLFHSILLIEKRIKKHVIKMIKFSSCDINFS